MSHTLKGLVRDVKTLAQLSFWRTTAQRVRSWSTRLHWGTFGRVERQKRFTAAQIQLKVINACLMRAWARFHDSSVDDPDLAIPYCHWEEDKQHARMSATWIAPTSSRLQTHTLHLYRWGEFSVGDSKRIKVTSQSEQTKVLTTLIHSFLMELLGLDKTEEEQSNAIRALCFLEVSCHLKDCSEKVQLETLFRGEASPHPADPFELQSKGLNNP